MSDPEGDSHWFEYPVGVAGELAGAYIRTIIPFGVGLGAAFALMMAVGLIEEEGYLSGTLERLGLGSDVVSATSRGVGYLTRMSIASLGLCAVLGALGWCAAMCLRDVMTSRAVADAALHGAPRTAVPHPHQVASIAEVEFKPIRIGLIAAIVITGLFGLSRVTQAMVNPEPWALAIAAAVVLAAGAMVYAHHQLRHRVVPEQQERRALIAAHWTTSDERNAWRAAKSQTLARRSASVSESSPDPRVLRGESILNIGGGLGGLAFALFLVLLLIMYPEGDPNTGTAGPRAQYSEQTEQVLTLAMWLLVALMLAALGSAAIGHLIQGAGKRADAADLALTLQMPESRRPPQQLLQRFADAGTLKAVQVMAAFAGIGLVFGAATLTLASIDSDMFAGSADLFGAFAIPALVTSVISLSMLAGAFTWQAAEDVRSRPLRNEVLRRWPIPPTPRRVDGFQPAALRGPALTPTTTTH